MKERWLVGMATLAAILTLSGCGQDWASMSRDLTPRLPERTHTSTPTTQVTPTASVVTRHRNATGDLASGADTHIRNAGDLKLVIDYWTEQNPATWTADAGAAIQLTAHIEGAKDSRRIKVSRFTVRTVEDEPKVLLTDKGAFAVQPPFSYSSAIVTPAMNAKSMSLLLQYDLLVETAEDSGQFFRQTVLDQLKVDNAASLCAGGDSGTQYVRLWPHSHQVDGFFAAVWQRK